MKKMSGKRVAILATHGFEQAELEVPLRVCPGTSSGITKFSEHEAD